MIATLLPLLTGLALALPPQADPQADPEAAQARAQEAARASLPSSNDLVMLSYRPRFTTAKDLARTAGRMVGREVIVRDDDSGQVIERDNLQMIGDTLLVYDLPDPARRVVEVLEQVDEMFRQPEDKSESREYRPRFLSMSSIIEALDVYTQRREGPRTRISVLKDDGVMLVHDTPERLEMIFAFLRGLDVPRPQVLFSCYLVTGASDATSQGLPKELVDGMRDLVGMPGLQLVGRGMLRSSISTDSPQSIVLSQQHPRTYELSLSPGAFDEGSGVLSLDRCKLSEIVTSSNSYRDLFQTQTSVRLGEYTVLGATGSDPMFLVLHVQLFES